MTLSIRHHWPYPIGCQTRLTLWKGIQDWQLWKTSLEVLRILQRKDFEWKLFSYLYYSEWWGGMGEMCDSFLTVHFCIHPLGTCRNIQQHIHILRISRGIDPNTRLKSFWEYSQKVRMGKLLCKVVMDWKRLNYSYYKYDTLWGKNQATLWHFVGWHINSLLLLW